MWGQTTLGSISGVVRDAVTQAPITATIYYFPENTVFSGKVRDGASGFYELPPLPPGPYRVRAEASGYQPRDLFGFELRVAGRLQIDFDLQPASNVWDLTQIRTLTLGNSGFLAKIFGPDLRVQDTAMTAPPGEQAAPDSAVSKVIDPAQLQDLPLAGRDVYTLLVTQPGVNAEAATTRSLGVTVNGQRPSSSNFLLDGVEANNSLLSGPAFSVPPEAVQEYRASIADFSAEIGGTAGYTANAVTRAGGPKWHGSIWLYGTNEALNANSFQNNREGLKRAVSRQWQPGTQAGGPGGIRGLFLFASVQHASSNGSGPPVQLTLPTPLLTQNAAPGGSAQALLQKYPSPAPANGLALTDQIWFQPPVVLKQWFGFLRGDYFAPSGKTRITMRTAVARNNEPNFIWSPYPAFDSGLGETILNGGLNVTSTLRPNLFNDLRFAWNSDRLGWNRAHPEIPTLLDTSPQGTILPGSLAFFSFSNRSDTIQVGDTISWNARWNSLKAGAGALFRLREGALDAGEQGRYAFPTVIDFAQNLPSYFAISLDRLSLPDLQLPASERRYRADDGFFLFRTLCAQTGV